MILMPYKLTYKTFSERAILVEWPTRIDMKILKDIINFKDLIEQNNIKQILELKIAYNSLLVIYDKYITNFEHEITSIDKIYHSNKTFNKIDVLLWSIPVCYDDIFGLDLELISKEKNISKEEIIKRHSEVVYTVYFIGFLPGFLYLGGLDEALYTPRKSTPRLCIEKGAVAIGENQTGVYPNASPGGWNIIGNSPINFFDVSKDKPCFAKAGDQIQFYPVSKKEHHDIKILVDAHIYHIESEVLND
jgi:inhibitor of KinA